MQQATQEIRLPPHDLDAEEAVLGSLLVDSEAIFKIQHILNAEDFYRDRYRYIYEACLDLVNRPEAEPLNEISVAHQLAVRDRLEACGGAAFLSHLVATLPTSVYVEQYARQVRDAAILRHLIEAGQEITRLGYEEPEPERALEKAEELLFRLRHGQAIRDFVHIREVLDRYFEESGLAAAPGERVAHINTGLIDLDRLLGGLHRSDMIVVAARPSLGKTSLALNIARNAAVNQGAKVAIFSLEMGREQLVQRLLSSEAGVDTQRLRLGYHTEAEEGRIMEATGLLAEAPIYIDDTPALRAVEIRSKARRLHNEIEVDLVIVDYMQLIEGRGGRSDNRVQEISEISRALKALARELEVPVLAISQLSRAVEARSPHIPLLSDLRESGSIEQDADVVIFIYRDDVYYTKDEWERRYPTGPAYPKGIARLIVAKHRNGPTGEVETRFVERTAQFQNLETMRSQAQ